MPDSTQADAGYIRDTVTGTRDLRPKTEWEARVQLAACYRLIAHFGMDDLIFTHISARVPGEPHHFLINPYGPMFHEITASSLVKIDHDGEKLSDGPYDVNAAGFVIHSAIHMERHDVDCVLHTHTTAGVAVSAQQEGILPISQFAMRYYNRVAFHDYEGLALNLGERERLVADLGDRNTMILRNHGFLTCGRTIPEAFVLMYYAEQSARSQIAAQASPNPLVIPPHEVCESTAAQFENMPVPAGEREWVALTRMLDARDPSYRT